jgi:hypothetical protein
MEISNKKYNEKMKSKNMSEKTNNEEFFTPPKSLQKNDVKRHARDRENNITTMLGCKHSNAIKNLMKKFVDNFSLLTSKEKKKVGN